MRVADRLEVLVLVDNVTDLPLTLTTRAADT
jgi:hypothetical protein